MKESENDIFDDLEKRLKLRALLARKKAEEFAKFDPLIDKVDELTLEKIHERNKILEKLKQNPGLIL
jgi:hypothetical protein